MINTVKELLGIMNTKAHKMVVGMTVQFRER